MTWLYEILTARWACLVQAAGRGRRLEEKVDRLLDREAAMEINMVDKNQELLDEIKQTRADVEKFVAEHTAAKQEEIDSAVAAAKSAWEAGDDAAHDKAMADLKAIRDSLQPTFSPSAN